VSRCRDSADRADGRRVSRARQSRTDPRRGCKATSRPPTAATRGRPSYGVAPRRSSQAMCRRRARAGVNEVGAQ
jgi:hypothetical protein